MMAMFFMCLVLMGGLIALGRRVEPVVDATLPAHACSVCEATVAGPDARCLGCGAEPGEAPLYRDGAFVLTTRRLIDGARVVLLDVAPATAVTVASRGVPSGASDGMGCALLVAGASALLAMRYPDAGYSPSLVGVAVAALLASPFFLLYSYTEPPAVEHVVRLINGDRNREIYRSRDRQRVRIVAARLRKAMTTRASESH